MARTVVPCRAQNGRVTIVRDVPLSSENVVAVNKHPEHESYEPFVPVQVEDETYQKEDRKMRGR